MARVVKPAVAAAFHASTSSSAPDGIALRTAATAVQKVRRAQSAQSVDLIGTSKGVVSAGGSTTLSDKFELSSESVDRCLFGNQMFVETCAKRVDFRIETIEPFRNLRNMGEGFEELPSSKDAADHDA